MNILRCSKSCLSHTPRLLLRILCFEYSLKQCWKATSCLCEVRSLWEVVEFTPQVEEQKVLENSQLLSAHSPRDFSNAGKDGCVCVCARMHASKRLLLHITRWAVPCRRHIRQVRDFARTRFQHSSTPSIQVSFKLFRFMQIQRLLTSLPLSASCGTSSFCRESLPAWNAVPMWLQCTTEMSTSASNLLSVFRYQSSESPNVRKFQSYLLYWVQLILKICKLHGDIAAGP